MLGTFFITAAGEGTCGRSCQHPCRVLFPAAGTKNMQTLLKGTQITSLQAGLSNAGVEDIEARSYDKGPRVEEGTVTLFSSRCSGGNTARTSSLEGPQTTSRKLGSAMPTLSRCKQGVMRRSRGWRTVCYRTLHCPRLPSKHCCSLVLHPCRIFSLLRRGRRRCYHTLFKPAARHRISILPSSKRHLC